eukprot:scaffold164200_cov47-Prasinocladus_malaysianus.AAC.1
MAVDSPKYLSDEQHPTSKPSAAKRVSEKAKEQTQHYPKGCQPETASKAASEHAAGDRLASAPKLQPDKPMNKRHLDYEEFKPEPRSQQPVRQFVSVDCIPSAPKLDVAYHVGHPSEQYFEDRQIESCYSPTALSRQESGKCSRTLQSSIHLSSICRIM